VLAILQHRLQHGIAHLRLLALEPCTSPSEHSDTSIPRVCERLCRGQRKAEDLARSIPLVQSTSWAGEGQRSLQ
jgi:hypothetical protein